MQKHTVTDNAAQQRYEMDLGDGKAFVEYSTTPDAIILTYAYVPQQHEGKGIGSELARTVLEMIRDKGMQVVPQCIFIAQYIRRHPEWEQIIYKKLK